MVSVILLFSFMLERDFQFEKGEKMTVTIEQGLDRMRLEMQIEKQIEATTEVAKTGTPDELLESVEELQAKMNQATVNDLKYDRARMESKLAVLQKALNKRI